MKKPALAILQDIYQLTINSKGSYFDQLQPLASSGHLSNKSLLLKVIFDLCEVIDKQSDQIEVLQANKEETAKKLETLEENIELLFTKQKLLTKKFSENMEESPDPTKPLPTNS